MTTTKPEVPIVNMLPNVEDLILIFVAIIVLVVVHFQDYYDPESIFVLKSSQLLFDLDLW